MKNYRILIILWVLFGYNSLECTAQFNEFAHYTTKDGLLANDSWSDAVSVVDKQHRFWFQPSATKMNVISPDGKLINAYDPADGLIEENNRRIIRDRSNRMWCFGWGFSVFDHERWRTFRAKDIPIQANLIHNLFYWQGEPIVIAENGFFLTYDTVKYALKTPAKLPFIGLRDSLTSVLQHESTEETYFFLKHTNWILHWKQGKLDSIQRLPKELFYHFIGEHLVAHDGSLEQPLRHLWVLEGKQWVIKQVPFQGIPLAWQSNHLYLSQLIGKDIVRVHEWTDALSFTKCFTLKFNHELRSVTRDKKDVFWVTTANGILKVYPNMVHYNATEYPCLDDLHVILGDRRHNIWFGSQSKGFSFLSEKDEFKVHYVSAENPSAPKKLVQPTGLLLNDGKMLFFSQGIVATDGVTWQKFYPHRFDNFYISQLKDGRLLLGTDRGLGISEGTHFAGLTSKWRFIDSKKGYPLNNVISATEDPYGRIWLGRFSTGVAVYLPKTDTVLCWKVSNDPNSFGLGASKCDNQGNLWLGGKHGLHFLKNAPNLDVYQLSFKDFKKISEPVIGDKGIQSMELYKEKYLIVGTEKGFGILNLPNFYAQKQPQWLFFNNENGFSTESCEQNAIWIDSFRVGKGWIGHDKGATLADLDQLIAQFSTISIQADSLKCGNILKSDLKKALNIPERGQESRIYFSSSEKNIVSFSYKIDDIGAYIYAPHPYIVLPNSLNSGNHQLKVVAVAVDGNISEEKVFKITIPYPFYQTWWFGFIIVSIIISGLWYWNKLTQLEIQSKSQKIQLQETEIALQESKIESQASKLQLQESEIALQESKIESQASKIQLQASELQLQESAIELQDSKIQLQEFKLQLQRLESKVIVNQLNPHFIKNSFNFLQIRLKRFKDILGVDYASKLDHSITSVFHQSVKGKLYHTLAEELSVVKNHLDMECMRYSKPEEKLIQYQIKEAKIKNLMHIKIPLFQLQIHCENAVKHGLRNNEDTDGGGMIGIDFEETTDYLFIYIQDNGVGRQKAIEIEAKSAKNTNTGQGVKMLNQFHAMLNKKNKDTQLSIHQFYTDNIFLNDDNEGCGTKVTIQLPKQNFNYEI